MLCVKFLLINQNELNGNIKYVFHKSLLQNNTEQDSWQSNEIEANEWNDVLYFI